MAQQRQHVQIHRKISLRRRLLRSAASGAAYVPFLGDGDLAAQLYADRKIYGADLDPARVATARKRISGDLRVADCDGWPFPGAEEPFAVADFDAYSYPWSSFRAFWGQAKKADRLVLFFTDGQVQAVKRTGHWKEPSGNKRHDPRINDRRKIFNFYPRRVVYPWLQDHCQGWKVVRKSFYRRKDMYYMGAILDREN